MDSDFSPRRRYSGGRQALYYMWPEMEFFGRDPIRRIFDLERRMLSIDKVEERLRAVEERTMLIMRHVEACEAQGKKAELDRARTRTELRWFAAMIMIAVAPQFLGFVAHFIGRTF